MAGSPYASALGRLKVHLPALLLAEAYPPLVAARDAGEMAKLLEPTPYGAALVRASAAYKGPDLLEVAINRLFVERNRLGYEVAPYAGKPIVTAYLRRWDIQNIAVILSAKATGRRLGESETFLVSSRDQPVGLFAGPMSLDDFRGLLGQVNVESVVNQLVRFGYGAPLLPLLEGFQRTGDIFPLLHALDRYYYRELLEATRFFQGDEWTIRRFLQSEIDIRNALLLLKGKDAGLSAETILERFLDGGEFPRTGAQEAIGASRGLPELVAALEPRFPKLSEGLSRYTSDRSLVGFEVVLTRERSIRVLRLLRSYPLSLAIIFGYLLLSELERNDLRRIVFAKAYGISAEDVRPLLLVPQL